MSFHQELISRFPIRKTGVQKDAFLAYAADEARKMGYTAQVEDIKNNRNLIVGDPDSAKVVFTAHYDTPATMFVPNFITPRNIPVYILYQLIPIGLILALSAAAICLCKYVLGITDFNALYAVFWVCYFGSLMLMLLGPANKNNHNDNTSGVAVLLEMMQKLPESARAHTAFIFFDNEEKHMQGSGSFAKAHKDVKQNTLIVNLDCVGFGDHLFTLAKKGAQQHALYPLFTASLQPTDGKTMEHFRSSSSVYPSDQASFRCGIAICAAKRVKGVGYYISRIHTNRDTECDQRNLDYLSDSLCAFAQSIDQK